jgi:hypothetical protein
LVVALQGALDGRSGRLAVQVSEPEVVLEQMRDVALEPVQTREGVLAYRQEDVQIEVPCAEDLAELDGQSFVGRVVEEVLLELVEDQVDRGDAGPLGKVT